MLARGHPLLTISRNRLESGQQCGMNPICPTCGRRADDPTPPGEQAACDYGHRWVVQPGMSLTEATKRLTALGFIVLPGEVRLKGESYETYLLGRLSDASPVALITATRGSVPLSEATFLATVKRAVDDRHNATRQEPDAFFTMKLKLSDM